MVKRLLRPFVLLIEVLLLAWAVLLLSEYFGWSFVREAGGVAVAANDCGTPFRVVVVRPFRVVVAAGHKNPSRHSRRAQGALQRLLPVA